LITESLSTLKIHKLTQAQYERERDAGRLDENALYLTPDEATIGVIGMINGSITLAQGDWYLGDDGLYHNDEGDGACSGVTADATVIVTPDPSILDSFNAYIDCGIRCVDQGLDALFFVAEKDPNEYDDIVVNYTAFA
jgi:hypothetical protein